jgi:hypothetical protein
MGEGSSSYEMINVPVVAKTVLKRSGVAVQLKLTCN